MWREFWGVILESGKPHVEGRYDYPLYLTMATLSFRDQSVNTYESPSYNRAQEVKMRYSDEASGPEYLLCTLGTLSSAGIVHQIAQVPMNIPISRRKSVTFTATARIHLMGYIDYS